MDKRSFNVDVTQEEGMFWGQIDELPGTFASGSTLEELMEAMAEAIGFVLEAEGKITNIEEVDVPSPTKWRRKSPPMPSPQVKSLELVV